MRTLLRGFALMREAGGIVTCLLAVVLAIYATYTAAAMAGLFAGAVTLGVAIAIVCALGLHPDPTEPCELDAGYDALAAERQRLADIGRRAAEFERRRAITALGMTHPGVDL